MNIATMPELRKESMRIAGKLVSTEDSVVVLNPYTGKVIGTVPAGRPEHVRSAFAAARAYRPKLTRYERQRILQNTAEILRDRR
ncbi:MAG: aldehyde dehydrogenase family protein, partial [Hyphomicrobiales bacterium]|nr:aldehyde dehydrogenase family protein [Hyphomicrobiales bacterium]